MTKWGQVILAVCFSLTTFSGVGMELPSEYDRAREEQRSRLCLGRNDSNNGPWNLMRELPIRVDSEMMAGFMILMWSENQ